MAFGFQLHQADSSPQPIRTCIKLVGDAVRLGKGDPVKKVTGSISLGNGKVAQAVARAASGDRVWGVVVGVEQHTVTSGMSLERTHSPASTAQYILVRPIGSNKELYRILEDAAGGSVATTDLGKNADFVAADCDTTTGMSGYLLDSSSANTTNTLDLNIQDFYTAPSNVPGSSAILIVSFNKVADVDQATGV